jgi:glycosyltransferase involved in cell wall biosynthesis
MLESGWVDAHAADFDVMHVHFGFDAVSPDDLARVASSLRRHGKPLVLTVHDLRNPHHHERELHDAQLGVLVEAADALITLTPGAAAEIAERWGCEALVVPHPHVVEEPRLSRPRVPHRGYVIGVHAKSLRAGMDPLPVIEQIVATLPEMPGARLRVDAHTDVMTPGGPRHASDLEPRLRELAATDGVDLRVHDYFSDDELWDYLQSLDVSVLPYRFGTHSGWLEACHDLGTTVVAPDCGHYADQRPCLLYSAPGSLPDDGAPTLRDALLRAYHERPSWRAEPEERRRERHDVSRAHEQVYADALAAAAERGVACAS